MLVVLDHTDASRRSRMLFEQYIVFFPKTRTDCQPAPAISFVC